MDVCHKDSPYFDPSSVTTPPLCDIVDASFYLVGRIREILDAQGL